jgi:very-short-patch-repair endonuclease
MIRRLKRTGVKGELLRQPRPRVHARPKWGTRTSYNRQAALEARAQQDIRGSLEERLFYRALLDWGFIPGVDFDFQSSMMGGRQELGGLVADFLFFVPKVIVNPMSVWHTMTLANERRDDDQTVILESMGYTQLEIWPTEIHDPIALDNWIHAHIMLLWGQGSPGVWSGTVAPESFLAGIEGEFLRRIEYTLDAVIQTLGITLPIVVPETEAAKTVQASLSVGRMSLSGRIPSRPNDKGSI